MVIGGSLELPGRRPPSAAARAVIWHELECGDYRADRSLWLELAAGARPPEIPARADRRRHRGNGGAGNLAAPARILDVGAGTGRISRELARAGHRVTALDIDPDLLDALVERDGGGNVETVCADARSFSLIQTHFDACFVPMQTIQLLGDRDQRLAFLRRAAAHLRGGGLLACAIVTTVEPFDCSAGQPGPAPETTHAWGSLYVSRPTRVEVRGGRVVIERERRIIAPGEDASGSGSIERDVTELAELAAAELESEGSEVGLEPQGIVAIAPTADHVGSEVVLFHA